VAGFPHVLKLGLPALRAARTRGASEDEARIEALLRIMTSLCDTCLLHRGGETALAAAQRGASSVLAAGGITNAAGIAAFAALEETLMGLWASPGGSADLLAATLFVDALFPQRIGAQS
jgi:triphosphoribosyl-dephospho-CoA synthase